MNKKSIIGVIEHAKKKRDLDTFEPIPLQLPLEPPSQFPKAEKSEEKSERGVWTFDL